MKNLTYKHKKINYFNEIFFYSYKLKSFWAEAVMTFKLNANHITINFIFEIILIIN